MEGKELACKLTQVKLHTQTHTHTHASTHTKTHTCKEINTQAACTRGRRMAKTCGNICGQQPQPLSHVCRLRRLRGVLGGGVGPLVGVSVRATVRSLIT